MSEENAWTLFGIASIIIHLSNWLKYSGKNRMVLNAKMSKRKSTKYNIWTLWMLPFGILTLAILLLKAVH